jgi:hypothetical protein
MDLTKIAFLLLIRHNPKCLLTIKSSNRKRIKVLIPLIIKSKLEVTNLINHKEAEVDLKIG